MDCAVRGLLIFMSAASLYAQAPSAAQEPAGLETKWEIAPVLQQVAAHAEQLSPVLDKIHAQAWVEKGASDTYVAQLQSSKEQAVTLAAEAKALAGNPERLSGLLQVMFRLQGLDSMLASLGEGMRRYQGAAAAQGLASAVGKYGATREKLQRYIVNLAAEQEQDLKVMDQEAQRCRGILTQAPATRKR
jgi:hypothetical protein